MTVKIEQLTGGYTGVPVIKNISTTLLDGTMTALVGLNGAGKSTLIKHLIGQLESYSGTVSIDDIYLSTDRNAFKRQIAYVPEQPILYEELTFKEHIILLGKSYGLSEGESLKRAAPYVEKFRLVDRLEWLPANFSKGMQQKVMLIGAFMLPVRVLIIDEPFIGLDPIAMKDLLAMLNDKKSEGCTILMSTHVLSTAEKESDYFILMHQGEIKQQGSLAQLKEQSPTAQTLDDIYVSMIEGASHGII